MHNTIFKTMFPKLIQDLPGDKIKYSNNDINTFYDNVKKTVLTDNIHNTDFINLVKTHGVIEIQEQFFPAIAKIYNVNVHVNNTILKYEPVTSSNDVIQILFTPPAAGSTSGHYDKKINHVYSTYKYLGITYPFSRAILNIGGNCTSSG